ncbi:hypothetical protein BaRGS_00000294 [Batillaria attramentaria]|uniref:Uncharacterized protein n=1 Tax=Batillaria attramentaria TaxID=370345 RepID=A0ABD0MDL9_9CAEN
MEKACQRSIPLADERLHSLQARLIRKNNLDNVRQASFRTCKRLIAVVGWVSDPADILIHRDSAGIITFREHLQRATFLGGEPFPSCSALFVRTSNTPNPAEPNSEQAHILHTYRTSGSYILVTPEATADSSSTVRCLERCSGR